jgi:6-phosphofructokinase 1
VRLAILTGGGDVPGLNSCIKAVVMRASEIDWEVVGFRRGWGGPLHYNPDDDGPQDRWLQPLNPDIVRTIDRTGGTFLHTSRTHPGKVKADDLPGFLADSKNAVPNGELFNCTPHIMAVVEALEIDALIAIGGDDTLSYAAHFSRTGLARRVHSQDHGQ